MKHLGSSGIAVEKIGSSVWKWTIGLESSKFLEKSFVKQVNDHQDFNLNPIRAVETWGHHKSIDRFEFTMPYLDWESGYTTTEYKILSDAIRLSLTNRAKKESAGFKDICLKEIQRIKHDLTKEDFVETCGAIIKLASMINKEKDFYPVSFAHGDFGLANLLVSPDRHVFAIDYTPTFIQSPLIDATTLLLSIEMGDHTSEQQKLAALILNDFASYQSKLEILRRIKMLGWLLHAQDTEWRKYLHKRLND